MSVSDVKLNAGRFGILNVLGDCLSMTFAIHGKTEKKQDAR